MKTPIFLFLACLLAVIGASFLFLFSDKIETVLIKQPTLPLDNFGSEESLIEVPEGEILLYEGKLDSTWKVAGSDSIEKLMVVNISDQKDKKTQFCFVYENPSDETGNNQPRTLSYHNGTPILDDKNKQISLKFESSKCQWEGQTRNGYNIVLTDASAVNIDDNFKLGNSVYLVYNNNSQLVADNGYFNISIELDKFENGLWNEINNWTTLQNKFFNPDGFTFGNWSYYNMTLTSEVPIRVNGWRADFNGELEINFADICSQIENNETYQQGDNGTGVLGNANCSFNINENAGQWILSLEYWNRGDNDPTISPSNSRYNSGDLNVTQESATIGLGHLQISDNYPYNNLVGYWNFDKDQSTTGYDFTDNNNDGTYIGSSGHSNANCMPDFGECYQGVTTSGNYLDVPNPSRFLASNNVTIMFWIRVETTSTGEYDILSTSDTASPWEGITIRMDEDYICNIPDGAIGFWVGDNTNYGACSQTALNDGQWHHVVGRAVERGAGSVDNITLFIDGAVDISVLRSIDFTAESPTNLGIGGAGTAFSTDGEFPDELDEVMFFNVSLNDSEIFEIYRNQSARFKPRGEQLHLIVNDTTIYGNNRANITLTNLNATLNTNVSGRVGYWNFSDGYLANDPDLVAFYVFDWNTGFNDTSRNGFNLSNNGNEVTGSIGFINGSMELDGTNDYASHSDFGTYLENQPAITVSTWLNHDDITSGDQDIIDDAATSVGVLRLAWDTSEQYEVTMFLNGVQRTITSDNAYTDAGTWHHVLWRWSGTELAMWVDGVKQSSTYTGSGNTRDPSSTLFRIGGSTESSTDFDGRMDNVMFFNRSLSEIEIQHLYATQSINKSGGVGLNKLEFSERKNFTIIDGGIKAHNLSIKNESTHFFVELEYLATNTTTPFYTPIVSGDITLDWWAEAEGVSGFSDTTAPTVNLNHHANDTHVTTNTTFFNATFTDNVNVTNATLYVWNSTKDLIGTNFTVIGVTSASVNVSLHLPRNGTYVWNFDAYDNWTTPNLGRNSTNFTVILNIPAAADTTPPTINDIPPDETVTFFDYTINRQFNATDDVALDTWTVNDTVNWEINASGHLKNITALHVGNHQVNVSINDTSDNRATTIWTLTIDKRNLSATLSGTTPITYPTAGDVASSESNPSDGDVTYTMFRNNISKSSPDTEVLGVGTYEYILNTTGGQNWSSNTTLDTFQLVVNKGTGAIELRLNGTQGNTTIQVQSTILLDVNLTTGNFGTLNLTVGGTHENSSASTNLSWSRAFNTLGDFEVGGNYSGDGNWTGALVKYNVSVTDTVLPTFNQTLTTLNINFGQSATITVNGSDDFDLDGYAVNDTLFWSIDNQGVLSNVTALGGGEYNINVTINDSSNNLATTLWQVNVAQIASSISLTINGTEGNVTLWQFNQTDVNVSRSAGEGTVQLYIAGSEVNSSTPPIQNYYNWSTAGAINVTAIEEASQNYTRSSVQWNVTVVAVVPETIFPHLNVTGNRTETFGAYTVNESFNASDDTGIDMWTINNTVDFNITQYGELTNITMLAVGTHVINVTVNDTEGNYNSTLWQIIVNQATPVGSLSVTPSLSVTYPTETTATGSETNNFDGDVTYTLYRQGVARTNPETDTLAFNNWNYTYNTTGGQNWTAVEGLDSDILSIGQEVGLVNLTLNGTDGNITITAGDSINISAIRLVGELNITLYRDGSQINTSTTNITNHTENFASTGIINITAITEEGNYTKAFETWWVNVTSAADTIAPYFTNTGSNRTVTFGAYTIGEDFNATDAVGFDSYSINDTVNFQINSTGFLKNITMLAVGTYVINITINDTSNNQNGTLWELVITQAAPAGNLAITPSTSVTYGTATTATGTESNPSDGDLTYQLFLDGSLVANPYATTHGAGSYNYVYNTTGGENWTADASLDSDTLTVNKNTSLIRLLLNGTNGDKTIPNNTQANFTGYMITGNTAENMQLYMNGTLWNNGTTPLENISLFDAVASYPINLSYLGNENFTATSVVYTLTVNVPAVAGAFVCSAGVTVLDIGEAKPFGRLCYIITSGKPIGQKGGIFSFT